jgi:sec-independent protein translocase protein TatA
MFGNAFGWPHLLIILVILLLLFGAPKLPALAKSIAQSMKIFRTEMGPNASSNGSSAAPSTGTTNPSNDDTTGTTGPSTDLPPKP